MSEPLLVTAGDPAGVGYEISLRAAHVLRARADFVFFGDAACLQARARAMGFSQTDLAHWKWVDVGRCSADALNAAAPTAEGGALQLAALERAATWMLEGRGRALVTAPMSKEAVELSGHAFRGHTEYLASRSGLAMDAVTMLFLGPRLKVALVTTHLALEAVPSEIKVDRVERSIRHLTEALGELGALPGLVAVCGLNPHAGDGGLFGTEEAQLVKPAVDIMQGRSLNVTLVGPIGAESAFRHAADGRYAGVVAMYHDQATIASKLLDWGAAVNVTWGLPFVRTSVDHGPAYDLAKGGASFDGMLAAMDMALSLTERPRDA